MVCGVVTAVVGGDCSGDGSCGWWVVMAVVSDDCGSENGG